MITMIRRPTEPTTIGMCSCRMCDRAALRVRVDGPFDPASGMRLMLPRFFSSVWARRSCSSEYSRDAARLEGDNASTAMKSVVVDPHTYDWEATRPAPPAPDHHLRDARCRFHAPSNSGFRKNTRHICRLIEKFHTPATRDHCC